MGDEKETSHFYIIILMFIYLRGINSTMCKDKTDSHGFTNVLAMCRGGTLTAGRLVVDTYDTGVMDQDSCKCTVRLSGGGPVNLDYKAYPGTVPASDCGSILKFTRHPSNTYTEYGCEHVTGDRLMNFANNDLLNITLSRVSADVQWKSGYCILIESNVNIIVTCVGSSALTSTTTTPPTTTTSPTTTTFTTSPGSSSVQTGTNGTGGDGSDKSIGIEVIAGAAAGGGVVLIIIIIIVIIVIMRRKKDASAKRSDGTFTVDIQPYAVATPKFYQQDTEDALTSNPLYESAGPQDPDTNHIVTKTGDVYAQVQKPNKSKHSIRGELNSVVPSETSPSGDVYTVNSVVPSETSPSGDVYTVNSVVPSETSPSGDVYTVNSVVPSETSPSGDVYAVVNKPKKPSNDVKEEVQKDEDKRPSRYKNKDGLVYAEMEDTTSRPQPRPPVRPTPITDKVIYSEVDTGV